MLKITKLNKSKMSFEDIYKYIDKNDVPKEHLKDVYYKDINDDNGNHICRQYKVTDKNDIINEFIIEREMVDKNLDNDIFYLTHTYENPHISLDLDDEEELF